MKWTTKNSVNGLGRKQAILSKTITKTKRLPQLHNMIMDNVRNMSDEELIFVLGMVRTSADSIESFVEDLNERQELLVELYDQYKDVIDEFKRRQSVFSIRPS